MGTVHRLAYSQVEYAQRCTLEAWLRGGEYERVALSSRTFPASALPSWVRGGAMALKVRDSRFSYPGVLHQVEGFTVQSRGIHDLKCQRVLDTR